MTELSAARWVVLEGLGLGLASQLLYKVYGDVARSRRTRK